MPPTRTRTGPEVLRVVWLPGTDRLHGTCHCGAATVAEDPGAVWDWLLGHPDGHDPGPARAAAPERSPR